MPFYFQLSKLLEQEIVAGRYEPGIRPPSEPEISSRYGLSRTTVRQALSALITGAGAGMGRAAAVKFAVEGARVGLVDVDEEAAHETAALVGDAALILPRTCETRRRSRTPSTAQSPFSPRTRLRTRQAPSGRPTAA